MAGITFEDWLISNGDAGFQSLDDLMNDAMDFQMGDATLIDSPPKKQSFKFTKNASSLSSVMVSTSTLSSSVVAPKGVSSSTVKFSTASLVDVAPTIGSTTESTSSKLKQPVASSTTVKKPLPSTPSCVTSVPPTKIARKRPVASSTTVRKPLPLTASSSSTTDSVVSVTIAPPAKIAKKRAPRKNATVSSNIISSTSTPAVDLIPTITTSAKSSTPLNTPLPSQLNEVAVTDNVQAILEEINGTVGNIRQGVLIFHSYMRNFHQRMLRMERMMVYMRDEQLTRFLNPQISLRYGVSTDNGDNKDDDC